MTFFAYMLRCSDGSYYAGHTDDIERRVAQHQAGELPGYTHERRPITLVWSEDFASREEALAAEQQIKGWSRAKKEALIAGDGSSISRPGRRAALRDEASTSSASSQAERGQGARSPAPLPVIVLVRPQLGENIGKAARAMLNFGLTELRLVAPRDGWPNPQAGPAASGADSVLEQATVYDSVAAAVADCTHVYATTVRKRGVTKPVVTPEVAARAIHADAGRSAILFGPERSGLETDDVAVARTIITVPINPAFGSLNLAQAVILVAYEWSKGQALASPPETELDPPAPQGELDGMIAQLDTLLDAAGYFFPTDRAPSSRRTLRTMLTKPGWTSLEVRTMRGVLSALAPRRRG
jgi:tRNA/rRNA methyltransferase